MAGSVFSQKTCSTSDPSGPEMWPFLGIWVSEAIDQVARATRAKHGRSHPGPRLRDDRARVGREALTGKECPVQLATAGS